jgi:hypothetical protein
MKAGGEGRAPAGGRAITAVSQSYLWYAGYGSNLSWDRFRCYLSGGKPPFSHEDFKGNQGYNRDPSRPVEKATIQIAHQLYFALPEGIEGTRPWGPGGVAFIDPESSDGTRTICAIWKITREQYAHVKSQEGAWYKREIELPPRGGYPVVTVTHPIRLRQLVPPGPGYLKTIATGLRKTCGLSHDEMVSYLMDKPGIQGNLTRSELEAWLGV